MPEDSDSGEVNVDIQSLVDYSIEMALLAGSATVPADGAMVPQLTGDGLAGPILRPAIAAGRPPMPVDTLPAGVHAAYVIDQRFAAFARVLADLQRGMISISNAAGVVAETYATADDANASDLSRVAFAFGDEGVNPPSGFRDVTLMSEQADGGGRVEVTESTRASPDPTRQSDVQVVTTVLSDEEGNPISTTVEELSTGSAGELRTTTVTVHGEEGDTIVRTTVRTDPDGTIHIATQETAPDGTTGPRTEEVLRPGGAPEPGEEPELGPLEEVVAHFDLHPDGDGEITRLP